jgi:endonuclease/exonuclease/phosphatase family metal-dependent hydrolase
MPDIAILSWNIKDLNESQINDANFIALMVKVIQQQKANLVSILETKSDKGKDLGNKLKGKLGAKWDAHSSTKSAPNSNKPENYVFLWDGASVTSTNQFKFPDGQNPAIGFPNQHNNSKKKSPSRFPYVGKFKAGKTTFTCVSFHTTFASCDIAEANQNLAKINEVINDADVIVMGDFNDDPSNSRKYRGVLTFEPLIKTIGCNYYINVKTSLCQAFDPTWKKSTDCRASIYDNFFVKTAGNLTVKKAEVVDLVDALQDPNWLSAYGKDLFNSWAARENKTKAKRKNWTPIPLFKPAEKIATLEDAHEVHWVAVSDHLPIRMEVTVK